MGHTVVAVEFEIFGDIHTVYGIDVRLTHMYNGAAAARLALVVCHQGLGRDILDCKVTVTGRSCKDPVAQNSIAQPKGLEKIWILAFVHIYDFLSFNGAICF